MKKSVKNKMKWVTFIMLLLPFVLKSQSLYINPVQYTPQQLVEDILITGCLQAFNVQYTGDNLSKGYFERTVNNFAFENGVILSSGTVMNAMGPNNLTSTSANTLGGSDPQLQTLISSQINDAAVLEFDFVPHTNTLEFRYVFGSEEYPEFVNSSFNDVFGFFLTGPPCPGSAPFFNTNIATIPGTSIPVAINNVNQNVNNAYYITNNLPNSPIEYDGYTVALTAEACVVPCETYHIKLAIADAGDSAYDSGVFLEGGSLTSGDQFEFYSFNPDGSAAEVFYEGCCGYYVFVRADTVDYNLPLSIPLTIGGTATNGVDVTTIPNIFTIPPFQLLDTLSFCIELDSINEGNEYITLTTTNGCPCNPYPSSDTIWIYENPILEGGIIQNDTIICDGDTNYNLTLSSSHNTPTEITSFMWSTGSTANTISVVPDINAVTTYYLTITDICQQILVDSVKIRRSDLEEYTLTSNDMSCFGICDGDITMDVTSGVQPYTYSWSNGVNTQSIDSLCSDVYNYTITDSYSCQIFGSSTINEPPQISFNTTTISATCEGLSNGIIELEVNNGQFGGDWVYTINNQFFTLPIQPYNQYSFEGYGAGAYTIGVTDGRGCQFSEIVELDEVVIEINSSIEDNLCFGDSIGSIYLQINGGESPYVYNWSGGETSQNVDNLESGNYSVTVVDSRNCEKTSYFSVTQPSKLKLYNLPNDLICQGDTPNLNAWALGGVPPYEFNWYSSNTGSLLFTGDEFGIGIQESELILVEVVDDNECLQGYNASYVNVYTELSLNLFSAKDTVCSNDQVYIYGNYSGGDGNYTITDINGNIVEFPIIVNPQETQVYNYFLSDGCGDFVSDWILITVIPSPTAQIEFSPENGCVPLEVNLNNTLPQDGNRYRWVIDNGYVSYFSNSLEANITLKEPGTYNTKLTVTSEYGCVTTRYLSGNIVVFPKPYGNLYPDNESYTQLEPKVFFNYYGTNWSGAVTNFGDNSELEISPMEYNVFHIYNSPGHYFVNTIFESPDGCLDTVIIDVDIIPYYDLFVPNTINLSSPIVENTIFKPLFAKAVDGYEMFIYNRWGELIFKTTNTEIGWDGNYNNGRVIDGSYVYLIKYNIDGQWKSLTGTVNVIY